MPSLFHVTTWILFAVGLWNAFLTAVKGCLRHGKSESEIGIRRKILLPDELLDEIFDYVVQMPGTVDGFYVTALTDASTHFPPLQLRNQLRVWRKLCLSICLVNSSWYRVMSKRMFSTFFLISNIGGLDDLMINPTLLRSITGTKSNGSYVVRFDLYIEHLTDAVVMHVCEALQECVNLREFYLSIRFAPPESVELLLETLAAYAGRTMRILECYLPLRLSHFPMKYLHSFPNLVICAMSTSVNLDIDNNTIVPYNTFALPASCESLIFPYLRGLRIHRMEILEIVATWGTPLLQRLRVDHEQRYEIQESLDPLLAKIGAQLNILEVRYINIYLTQVLDRCPHVTEAAFDVRGQMWMASNPIAPMYPQLTNVGLRGCPHPEKRRDIGSFEILLYLSFFLAPETFPNVEVIKLLDFKVEYFGLMEHSPHLAQRWLETLARSKRIKVTVLDRYGKALDGDDLLPLQLMAEGAHQHNVFDDNDSDN